MHDLSYFRANFDRIAERLATRSNPPNLDHFRELDQKRRAAISQSEQLQARANAQGSQIFALRKAGGDATALQEELRTWKSQIAGLEEQKKAADEEFQELLAGIPNVPHESVPVGKSADDNVEVRRWGTPPAVRFRTQGPLGPGSGLGILDLERAAKITGARFASIGGWARSSSAP
jgi:seryl-tRNA synthetase